MARFVVYAKRTDECQAQLRMFCVTDDKEDKALERIERFIQVAKSRDVEVRINLRTTSKIIGCLSNSYSKLRQLLVVICEM